MDENESISTQNSATVNVEALRIALDINGELGKKQENFRTFKKFNHFRNALPQSIAAEVPRVKFTILNPKATALPPIKPQRSNEKQNYSMNDMTEDEETTPEISTESQVEDEKLTTESEPSDINNKRAAKTKIEAKEEYSEGSKDKLLATKIEEIPQLIENISSVLEEELSDSTEFSTTSTVFSDQTTSFVEEGETLTEIVAGENLTRVNRPLIKSTTKKPVSSTRRPITTFNRSGPTSSKRAKEEETQETNFESTTRRSLPQRGFNNFKRPQTTIVTTTSDLKEISSVDETTEQWPNPDITTTRSYNRLIRYGTTTPSTDEEDEEEQQKIETSTRRSFSKQKLKTLFETPTENIDHTSGYKSEYTTPYLTTRQPFGSLSRNKVPFVESSQARDYFGVSGHKNTGKSTANKFKSTIDKTNLNAVSEGGSPSIEIYDEVTTRTQADVAIGEKVNTVEVNQDILTTKPPFEGTTLISSGDTNDPEESTTEQILTEDTMPLKIYDLITESTIQKTDTTLETQEGTKTHKPILFPREFFSGQPDDFIPPSTTETITIDSESLKANKIESVTHEGSVALYNNTEESLAQKEASLERTLPTREPGIDLNINETSTTSGMEIIETDSVLEDSENGMTNEKEQEVYGSFTRPTTTEETDYYSSKTKEENSFNLSKEATTQRTPATRRPFGSFQRTTISSFLDIEQKSTVNNRTDIAANEEVGTKHTLHTRRPFTGFKRPTFNTIHATEKEENDVNVSTERFLYTRRPFGLRSVPSSRGAHSFGANKLRKSPTETIEEELDSTDNIENENTTNEQNTEKYSLRSRRPFAGSYRHTISTTEATTKETNSKLDINAENITNFKTSNKFPILTKTNSTNFKWPTTTENDIEEGTTGKLYQDAEEPSTKLNFNGDQTSDGNEDEEQFSTYKEHEHEESSEDNTGLLGTTETVLETSSPINVNPKAAEDDLNGTSEKGIFLSTIPSFDDQGITDILGEENSADLNVTGNKNKTTNLHIIKSEKVHYFTELPPISSSIASSEISTEESDNSIKSTTIREFLLRSKSTSALYDEVSNDPIVDEKSNTDEEEKTSSKVTHSIVGLSSFRTSTESTSKSEKVDRETTFKDSTTQRTSSGINKFPTKTDIETATEDKEMDSTLKKISNRFNLYKTTPKSFIISETTSNNKYGESEDNDEVSTHDSPPSFSQRQRQTLNSRTQTERTKSNINKHFYNRNEQSEEKFEEEVDEITPRRLHSSIYKQQSINSNSYRLTDTKEILKSYKLNKSQIQRTLPRPPQADNKEESEEKQHSDLVDDYPEKEIILANQELAFKKPSSSSFLTLHNRVQSQQTQDRDSEQDLVNNRFKNSLNTRARTQTNYNALTSKSSELTTEEEDKNVAISYTNTNRFGINRYNSTVANYLNKKTNNLSERNTNTAPPSHINIDNEDKLKIDIDKIDEDDEIKSQVRNSIKANVKQNNYNVYKGDDNDSKRRFQKYQFHRRTTTSTTTSTTAPVEEADAYNEAARTQVNLNDAYASEGQTSTITPETTAPITTESTSLLPATPLQRRIKIIKLKRPLISNQSINTNVNNAIASSATNLSTSHTETQNIVKLSSSELESQVDKTETLTETEITELTQTPIAPQTSPPTPKHIRKIIRKRIRPVNRNTGSTNATEDEKSTIKQNTNRYGLNRSTKFKTSPNEETKNDEKAEKEDDLGENRKIENLSKRGRYRFALSRGASNTAGNRNRFSNRRQPTSTTELPKPADNNRTDEDEDAIKEEIEKREENELTTTSYSATNRFRLTRPPSHTTESGIDIKEDNDSTVSAEVETTTSFDESSKNTNPATEQQKELLNGSLDFITSAYAGESSDDSLLKLRNKVKQDLANLSQDEDEGVLSTRFKSIKLTNEEDYREVDDPLFKLRNRVKQDFSKSSQVEGILSDRLKFSKNESEAEDKNDNLFLQLRNKVKQELAKDNQEEGVVNVKLKKVLENVNNTNTLSYIVEDSENDSVTTKENLSLQKIRDKVLNDLVTNEQNQGVVNSKLKKVLSEKNNSTRLHEDEMSTDLEETPGDGDFLETSKSFTPRKPFVPKSKSNSVDNEIQTTTTSTPRNRTTFRRRLVAKRPYNPTKSPLSALSATTKRTVTTAGKNKYFKPKTSRFPPLNAVNRNTGEGLTQSYRRGNRLPEEGSARGQNYADDYYQEYDEEEDDEAEDEEAEPKVEQPVKYHNIARPSALFDKAQNTILKKPTSDNKDDDEDEDEEEDDEEDEEDEEEEDENGNESESGSKSLQDADETISDHSAYKPKDNRIPPGARPALTTTPPIKKPFTSSRIVNTPYRPGTTTTAPRNKAHRLGSKSKSTTKSRVINLPLGVSVPNLTIKPVANDFERTTVLIPTKPAPFINPNTRAYERKYTGPTTESTVDSNNENNPLIEDLNIEALNARNKKIFDINSKKHTTLKPKVNMPSAKQSENTQEQQQEIDTELEDDENEYEYSVDGFATTTATITLNTNTQQQEHNQSATLDNTTKIGTKNTDDAANPSNANNLNEISSQDGFTTSPPPSTTLLHIFTLADGGHTTQNPLDDGYQPMPRLIVESVEPKHKVVEINRIVEVNSKEEKHRRKSKANTIVSIEGSQTYKVESLPHVEQLGEISVAKYVHQVDGSDITIEGRSTVTDYTPTEPTVPGATQPVRHSLPDESKEKRYGKALVPEVIREASETSTISLEGLFETARKGKVLNTIDDVDLPQANVGEIKSTAERSANNYHVETVTETPKAIESFNIFKSIAFDLAKINLEPNSKEIATNETNLESSSSTTITSIISGSLSEPMKSSVPIVTTTPAPEIPNEESTTVTTEDVKATTVIAALFPQYVRPIVPLLRPESNESSPLVISIANLDKVILSKARKMVNGVEVEEDEHHPESVTQPKIKNNSIPHSQTETDTPENLATINSQTQQNTEIHDSHAAFSSRLASVLKAPLTNTLTQIEKHIPNATNVTKNPLDKGKEETQTKLYTLNEGSVGGTTSSTIGSKISETISFSSETTVIRRKQPRKAKSKKFMNKTLTTNATATENVLRTPATVNSNGLTVTRRPVLSVRRRLINTSTAAAAANIQQTTASTFTIPSDSSSTVNDEYITTSKFKRLRTNRPPTFSSAAVDITTDATAATSLKANNKLNKNSTETLSNDLKLASSSLTSSSSVDDDVTAKQISKAQSSAALRRKFQARRLTTTTASNTNSDGTATEPPRTQNPLFKRRYSLTTYSPLSVKTGQQQSKTATTTASSSLSTLQTGTIDSLTTTVYVDGLENDEATDQVAKSSIHTSRFNQINGRLHIDDDDEEELDAAGIRRVGNDGVKSLTTLSSATKQPASRYLQQQTPQHQQQQHQQYSKLNYDDVITRRMDGSVIVDAKSLTDATTTTISTSTTATQASPIKKRKMIIKRKPQKTTPSSEESLAAKRRRPHKYQEPFVKINSSQSKAAVKTSTQAGRTYRPNLDYDYYDDEDVRLVGNKNDQQLKVILHGGGIIECLDQGNFPHPLSCRKFISCAKFETGGVVGWEYTCPKGLSYDPVGGMCNWAAGLGCKE